MLNDGWIGYDRRLKISETLYRKLVGHMVDYVSDPKMAVRFTDALSLNRRRHGHDTVMLAIYGAVVFDLDTPDTDPAFTTYGRVRVIPYEGGVMHEIRVRERLSDDNILSMLRKAMPVLRAAARHVLREGKPPVRGHRGLGQN